MKRGGAFVLPAPERISHTASIGLLLLSAPVALSMFQRKTRQRMPRAGASRSETAGGRRAGLNRLGADGRRGLPSSVFCLTRLSTTTRQERVRLLPMNRFIRLEREISRMPARAAKRRSTHEIGRPRCLFESKGDSSCAHQENRLCI